MRKCVATGASFVSDAESSGPQANTGVDNNDDVGPMGQNGTIVVIAAVVGSAGLLGCKLKKSYQAKSFKKD